MKVYGRIHFVKDRSTSVYLLHGCKPCLIDTGFPVTMEKTVFPYLETLGGDPKDISMAVLTHGHGDHYMGIPVVKRVSDVKVAVHELDAPLIEVEKDAVLLRQLHTAYPEAFPPVEEKAADLPRADILLRNGDRLNLAGLEVEVVHTPGHSLGAICLYQRGENILFTGDSIQGEAPLIYGDLDDYLRSLEHLGGMKVNLLLAAHRYPPAEEEVMNGDEAKTLLEASVEAVENCLGKVSETLQYAEHPMSVNEVTHNVPKIPVITVIRVIEKLIRDGRVGKAQTGTRYSWVD